MGIHSTYTQEIDDEICARIAEGEPLRQICRDKGIAWRTVYSWLAANEDFAARFAQARDVGMDAIAEESLEIADNSSNDWIEKQNDEGGVVSYTFNKEHVQRSKLRIETRLKLLAKWNPKKYGDKIETTHTGPQHIVIDGVLAKV